MIRIIYVDDNPEILKIGKTYLETNTDFIVDLAESGEKALSLLKQNTYHAVVSDYFMPDIDGITFLKLLRDYNTTIPFIFFTGGGEESVVIKALNSGADFYLKKGDDPGLQFLELTQIIRLLVSRIYSEEELKKSELKFRTIAEFSHDWLYWIDPHGTMVYVSPSCEEITGYTPEEFYQDPKLINRIVHEEDKIRWSSHLDNCTAKKRYLTIDIRILRKNGEIRWINHNCQSIFDSENQYMGRRVGNLDITDRKKIEAYLLHERNNFLKIFRAAPVGLLLLDKDTTITQANTAIAAMVLKDPADIIRNRGGGGLGCIYSLDDPRGCGYSTACVHCPLREGIEAVITRGISIHGKVIPLTLLIEGRPQIRWLSINAEPVKMDDAEQVIVAIDDITDERNLEISLRESEEKFRTLSDSTTAGIMMYQDDCWTYANKAAERISGYSIEELLSMHFWEIIHPDFRDTLIVHGQSRQSGDEILPRHIEIKIIRKNGEERWIDLVASTVVIGQKVAGLVTAVDITDRNQAEEKLALSEEKYRLIFENQIDLYYQTDMNGIITNLSPSCKKLTGWYPDELIGKSVLELYPNPQQREDLIRLLMSDEIVYDFETELTNKAGIPVPVSINCHIIRGKTGNPDGIEGTLRDITGRKQIEEALRTSEEHYHSLFNNMLEGFAFCQMLYDEHGKPIDWKYLDVNDAFERLTGLENIKGKFVSEAIPGIREQTPEIFEIYNRVVMSGIPEILDIEFTPLNMWVHLSVYRPEPGHFVAVFEDITKRKQDELTLHYLIAQYETILVNVPAMIWYKDISNTFIKINPAAALVFGKPINEIEGKQFNEIFPNLTDSYSAEDLEVIQTGKPKLGVTEELISAQGHHLWVQTDKVPLRDDKGNILGVLVVSTDITEMKRVKDVITLANKKLNLLSSITRHDIVNQLQVLFTSIELALEEEIPPKAQANINRAKGVAKNIERQIAFTQDYQDIGVYIPTWQNVESTIRNVVNSIDLGSITLSIDLTDLEVFADPLLEKVFHNLIDNSKRYGDKITGIRFSGYEESAGYIIICCDDGVGIPQQYKSGIFRREYYKHTGFGLNLSREILEITGITISETGEEGLGARFEIVIPKGGYRFHKTHPIHLNSWRFN